MTLGCALPTDDSTSLQTLGTATLRYRGYVYDTETGLYYLSSRYYNPVWGRFVTMRMAMLPRGQGFHR